MPLASSAEPNGPATITKTSRRPDEDLRCEAAALAWLADAEKRGGIHAARVVRATACELVEERVATRSPSRADARAIGAGLASMHAAGAGWFGCPPDRWPEDAALGYALDGSFTPLVLEQDAVESWGAYYAEHRIMRFTRTLRDSGTFGRSEVALMERVSARLAAGDFDAPQPELVRRGGHAAARLHGDLWAGNVLCSAQAAAQPEKPVCRDAAGNPCPGVLIDPMAHGGHAETDLAMLQLFGYPHLADVLAGYNEASPLAEGWQERVALHQLSPLLHHCVLFGGAYVGETLAAARGYA